jgi:hypothetical protein
MKSRRSRYLPNRISLHQLTTCDRRRACRRGTAASSKRATRSRSPAGWSPNPAFHMHTSGSGDRELTGAKDDQGCCVQGFSPSILYGAVSCRCGSAGALPQNWRSSELEAGAGVHHRCLAAVHRADDLLRGDPLQVRAGHRELSVPELTLDQRQRDPLVQQLDSVRMPKLVWRKPAPHPGLNGEVTQLRAHRGRVPRAATGWPVDHTEPQSWRPRRAVCDAGHPSHTG